MVLTRSRPMSRGTKGLQRSGFARRSFDDASAFYEDREHRLQERARSVVQNAVPRMVRMVTCRDVHEPVEKERPLRSEAYRRLVASLPCACCGIEGYSQHAHENVGKGWGLKVDDRRGMALCCARPGIEGCHTLFDQYRLLPGGKEAHHAQGRAWAVQTRQEILESGQWPKNLPLWED